MLILAYRSTFCFFLLVKPVITALINITQGGKDTVSFVWPGSTYVMLLWNSHFHPLLAPCSVGHATMEKDTCMNIFLISLHILFPLFLTSSPLPPTLPVPAFISSNPSFPFLPVIQSTVLAIFTSFLFPLSSLSNLPFPSFHARLYLPFS